MSAGFTNSRILELQRASGANGSEMGICSANDNDQVNVAGLQAHLEKRDNSGGKIGGIGTAERNENFAGNADGASLPRAPGGE